MRNSRHPMKKSNVGLLAKVIEETHEGLSDIRSDDLHSEQRPFSDPQFESNIGEQRPMHAKSIKQAASNINSRSSLDHRKSKEKSPQLTSFNLPKKTDRPHNAPASSRFEKITPKTFVQQKIFKSRSHTDLQIQGHPDWTSKGGQTRLFLTKKSETTLAGLEIKSNESKEAREDTEKHHASQHSIPKIYNALFQVRNREALSTKPKPMSFQSRPSGLPRHDMTRSLRSTQPSHRGDRKGEVLLIQQTTKSSDWVASGQKESMRKKPYHTINENLIGSLNYAKNQTSVEIQPPDPLASGTETNKAPFYFDKDEYFFEERAHRKNQDQ